MQLLTEQTADIQVPAASAWHYAANLMRFGEWFPGVLAISAGNTLDYSAKGKEYLETVRMPGGRTQQVRITVKEAQPNALLVTEGNLRPLLPRMEIAVEAVDDDNCRLTWRMYSRNDGLLARITLIPLARRVMRRRAQEGVAQLKRILEAR